MKIFAEILLRGMSQVFLLNNVTTGILFFAAIGYSYWFMGIGAIIGDLVGTFTALLLKYDRKDIQQGLYGYNGILVGLAIICVFGFNLVSVLALVFGAALSSIIRKGMSTWKVSPYTAPFIISTWIVMSLLIIFNIIPLQAGDMPEARHVDIIPETGRTTGLASGWLRSAWFYLASSALFFGIAYLGWTPLPWTVSTAARCWMLTLGSLLYFPGMSFILWGRLELGKNYFVSTDFGAQLFKDHQLITVGPYAIVRHPMYTGLILAALGSLLLYFTWTTLCFACFAPLMLVRARREEAVLAAEFGDAWTD